MTAVIAAAGVVGGNGSSSNWMKFRERRQQNKKVKICCFYSSSSVVDPYKTLRIQLGPSEYEVRKAFRQLALQHIQMYAEEAIVGFSFTKSTRLMISIVILELRVRHKRKLDIVPFVRTPR
ncbi:hypothetical protein RIF29_20490 [Crotalaria pallida]|uniref:Uncharacterized protein n=1 Tax=Crotalaria pallida TaxID=3830 RepID=A0AAN9F4L6_CROPI